MRLRRLGCEGGNRLACDGLVWDLDSGVAGRSAAADARLLAEKGCRRSEGRNCNALAYLLSSTEPARAWELLEKGCQQEDADSALNLCDSGAELDVARRGWWVDQLKRRLAEAKQEEEKAFYVLRVALFDGDLDAALPFVEPMQKRCARSDVRGCETLGAYQLARGERRRQADAAPRLPAPTR